MKTVLTVSTCPREGASYIEAALRSLDLAGADLADEKIIVSDGDFDRKKLPAPTDFCQWQVVQYDERTTCTSQVMWRILKLAIARGADQILYTEDDIRMARNGIARILNVGVSDDAFLTTYFDILQFGYKTPNGLYRLPMRSFLGNQCFLMPRRAIEYLLEKEQAHELSDVAVSWRGEESPWNHYISHVPCLVEHVGAVSVANSGLGLTFGRVATRWDPNLDAASLPPPEKAQDFLFPHNH